MQAYANGIAFDFAQKVPDRTAEEYSLLLEIDLDKQRTRNVSLRNKLLQYPKIILGQKHPPLTESNVPEMAILLDEGKRFRDAITHASPMPPMEQFIKELKAIRAGSPLASVERVLHKEDYLIELDMASLTRVVDAAVTVVSRIDETIDGYMRKLGYVVERTREGTFPPKAFQ